MSTANVVDARQYSGMSASLMPGGPKFTIQCGACPATFRTRIGHVDYPTVKCPDCGTWNRINVVTGGVES